MSGEVRGVVGCGSSGMYSAIHGSSRSTWVVHPDHTTFCVMNNDVVGDHTVAESVVENKQGVQGQNMLLIPGGNAAIRVRCDDGTARQVRHGQVPPWSWRDGSASF